MSFRWCSPAPAHSRWTPSRPPMNMCTLILQDQFLGLGNRGIRLALLILDDELHIGAARACCRVRSRYIWKPLTMSLPIWAKMPVIGAMKPMRSSSALAGRPAQSEHNAGQQPVRVSRCLCHVQSSLVVVTFLPVQEGTDANVFDFPSSPCAAAPLANSGGNAHQASRQIKNREHVNAAEHVLPPRHQRAQIFSQAKHNRRADRRHRPACRRRRARPSAAHRPRSSRRPFPG